MSSPTRRHSADSDDSTDLRDLELSEAYRPLNRQRSLSTFQPELLPLTLSEYDEQVVAEKTLGLVNGVALVVGGQIGSGIL